MKAQDNLLPSVKTYLDKHRKNVAHVGGKLPQYQIQKLIWLLLLFLVQYDCFGRNQQSYFSIMLYIIHFYLIA